ncbi:hypothetical protein [Intrasporangium flavum]|uniref:hypothetical protein n=1 Tax=Intrasporangium flavum TaxID=1428657 RepID=UPI001A9792F4|nr:hypothetical protein [Intrasporangium flavum]
MGTEIMTTVRSLHVVAELVLAGPQWRQSGSIELASRAGGFGTTRPPDLHVDGAELVGSAGRWPLDGSSARVLAEAVGVEVGEPAGVYHDGSHGDPDERLDVDAGQARWLGECWARGDAALRAFAPHERPVLWPEHFDVGITLGGVSYGVSPGDAHLREPYAYVSTSPVPSGPFWNVAFGAARPMTQLGDAVAVRAFFAEGARRLAGDAG